MAGQRTQQLADRIKVIVAEMLERRVKDPRLGFITITDVRVTGDTQHASVFYTVLGTDDDRATAAEILEEYRGRLRSFVGRGLGTRLTPSLEFILDALPEDAKHMDELLAQVAARDAELAAARAEQGYAGEADPYRKPRTEAEQAQDEQDALDAQAESDSGTHATDER